jgi:MFS family permease
LELETPSSRPSGEPARSLRLAIWEGCSSAAFGALTGNAIVTAFALALGARDFDLGLLTALTTVSAAGGLLGARIVGVVGRRKPLVTGAALAGRLVWALAGLIPFLPATPSVRVGVLLGIVFLSNFALNLSLSPWTSWMTDLVPPDRRGRYFGLRNTVISLVHMLSTYGAGVLASAAMRRIGGASALVPFFAASTVFALLTTWIFTRQWEPPLRAEPPIAFRHMLRIPFANPDFRRLLVFFILWSMVCGVAGPFYAPHMYRHLGMSVAQVALYSIFSGVCGLASQPLWGRIADRFGHRPVLAFNIVAVSTLPLIWLFATPGFLWPIWIDAMLTGIFWPGLNLATFNLVLGTAPAENRTSYLAVQSLVSGVFLAIAAVIGGLLAHAMAGWTWRVGPQTFVNFHVLYAISSLGRIALLPLALRLREDRARPFAALVQIAGDKATRLFADGLEAGLTFLRRLGRRS